MAKRSALLWPCLGVATLVACGDEPKPSAPGPHANTTTSSSGNGGDGATGGDGASGGAASAGGGQGAGGQGQGGGGGIAPADGACLGDFAFRAAGMAFAPPTPKELALAFAALAYSAEEHPIAIVLRGADPAAATVAAAPVMDDGNFAHVFLEGHVPTFTDAFIKQGSFETGTPQAQGALALRHQQGVLLLELVNLSLSAATASGCGQASVTLDAIIPSAERNEALTTSEGDTTVGELAGGDVKNDIQLRALFLAESIPFDFESL